RMKWVSRTSSAIPRNRSKRSVANFRSGSVISMCRPVISRLMSNPPLSGTDATLMCTWNLQIFAIFRNAAAGDRNALFFQHLGNLFVRQGTSRIFQLDKLFYLTFHDQQRCSVAHGAVDRFREEVPQLEYTLRGVGKFVC